MANAAVIRKPLPLFGMAAAGIAIACVAITRSHAFASNPDVLAWGVTFDLTLTIPLLYWLFVIRSGAARAIAVAPVFAIGAAIAAVILPRGDQQFLHELRFLVAPLEVVTLVLVVRSGRASGLIGTELAVLRYAVTGWRARADVPRNARAFTVHERIGWGSIVAALILVIAAESLAMHVIVQMWSVRFAWILTALELYGVLWLLGDYHALRLRPSYADDDALHIRYGLRWSVDIGFDDIASCQAIASEADWKRPAVLKVAMLDAPRFLLRLRTPAVAHGLLGLRKTIDAIAIAPDDDEAFASVLRRGRVPAETGSAARP